MHSTDGCRGRTSAPRGVDGGEHERMRFSIRGGHHAVYASVELAPGQIRDDGARGAAQRDARGPMHAAAKIASCDVGRLLPVRHPRDSECRRDTSRAEPLAEGLVEEHLAYGGVGVMSVEVDRDETR